MKEFDINKAKRYKKVQTRDGHDARIICFDRKDPVKPIVALIKDGDHEVIEYYGLTGKCDKNHPEKDLVMATEKNVRYLNIYEPEIIGNTLFETEEVAKAKENTIFAPAPYVTTLKLEWEE